MMETNQNKSEKCPYYELCKQSKIPYQCESPKYSFCSFYQDFLDARNLLGVDMHLRIDSLEKKSKPDDEINTLDEMDAQIEISSQIIRLAGMLEDRERVTVHLLKIQTLFKRVRHQLLHFLSDEFEKGVNSAQSFNDPVDHIGNIQLTVMNKQMRNLLDMVYEEWEKEKKQKPPEQNKEPDKSLSHSPYSILYWTFRYSEKFKTFLDKIMNQQPKSDMKKSSNDEWKEEIQKMSNEELFETINEFGDPDTYDPPQTVFFNLLKKEFLKRVNTKPNNVPALKHSIKDVVQKVNETIYGDKENDNHRSD